MKTVKWDWHWYFLGKTALRQSLYHFCVGNTAPPSDSFHDGELRSRGCLQEGLLGSTRAIRRSTESPCVPLQTNTCRGNSSGWATARCPGRWMEMKAERLHGGWGKQVALGTGHPEGSGCPELETQTETLRWALLWRWHSQALPLAHIPAPNPFSSPYVLVLGFF